MAIRFCREVLAKQYKCKGRCCCEESLIAALDRPAKLWCLIKFLKKMVFILSRLKSYLMVWMCWIFTFLHQNHLITNIEYETLLSHSFINVFHLISSSLYSRPVSRLSWSLLVKYYQTLQNLEYFHPLPRLVSKAKRKPCICITESLC